MGHKVFVSYKYADSKVEDLGIKDTVSILGYEFESDVPTKVRHYVNKLTEILEGSNQIYKGEDDGEDMSSLSDTTISSKLGDKIYDSSVTIVLISKGMNDVSKREKDQWIPWEISYSLREQSRKGRKSKTNGIVAVVLPDEDGSYDYYMSYSNDLHCELLNTDFLFDILSNNMFNKTNPTTCVRNGYLIYKAIDSYISSIRWSDFISNPETYIELAYFKAQNKDDYNIVKILP